VTSPLLTQGLELMIFGMGTVVVFLALLVLALRLMSTLIQRFFPDAVVTPVAIPVSEQRADRRRTPTVDPSPTSSCATRISRCWRPACASRTCCRSRTKLDRWASGRWRAGAARPSTPVSAISARTPGNACASSTGHAQHTAADAAARPEPARLPALCRRRGGQVRRARRAQRHRTCSASSMP
jgi:oxaloacetate decarboxylase gamma subunit